MKSIKRALALLLSLLLCVSLVPGELVRATDTPTITLSAEVAQPDTDVTVSITIEDNPGVMAMQFMIDYDTTLLTLKGYEEAEEEAAPKDCIA